MWGVSWNSLGRGKRINFMSGLKTERDKNGANQMGRKRGDGIEGNNDWRKS